MSRLVGISEMFADDREPNRFVFPAPILKKISSRITNEVAGINRVTYDISSKPPAVSNPLLLSLFLSLPIYVPVAYFYILGCAVVLVKRHRAVH